jgi:hypothetical protein
MNSSLYVVIDAYSPCGECIINIVFEIHLSITPRKGFLFYKGNRHEKNEAERHRH